MNDSRDLAEEKRIDKVKVVSVDGILAEAMRRIVNNESVSELFEK